MKFSDLYACSKCGLVYAAEVNNGICRMVARVPVLAPPVFCGGTIRPINHKPPVKDERQRDIEDELYGI